MIGTDRIHLCKYIIAPVRDAGQAVGENVAVTSPRKIREQLLPLRQPPPGTAAITAAAAASAYFGVFARALLASVSWTAPLCAVVLGPLIALRPRLHISRPCSNKSAWIAWHRGTDLV